MIKETAQRLFVLNLVKQIVTSHYFTASAVQLYTQIKIRAFNEFCCGQ